MAKINEITINGFKAFPSMYKLELEGKHLLMYGENGSGKSSIYYALHCLFNSYRKPDMGKKYFDINNPQNLINKNFIPKNVGDKPHVTVNWYDGNRNPFISTISDNGCQAFDRLAELDTYFINHQLLFSFFNFTNSKDINLFPVFQREILPYIFITEVGTYMSLMYEEIIRDSSKLSNKNSSKTINSKIKIFNICLEKVIGDINLNASDIYNSYFKEEGDPSLSIILSYPEVNPQPDVLLNGFRLKWDYPLVVNPVGNLVKAPNKSIIHPIISINVKENGKSIDKPHVYFNEAKLTAIALSIRFALLNLDNPAEGSFLALDDMLISLDMSNRVKVIEFLLRISNKYKIYLFTHDRAFFELTKDFVKEKFKDYKDNWLFKEIYNDIILTNNPVCYDSEDTYTRAIYHYKKFDYPASANYLRKSVEELMQFFPQYISRTEDGLPKEKLRAKIDAAKYLFECTDGDTTDIQTIIFSLGTLLNPLSHRSIDTNIYRTELDTIIKVIPKVKQHILKLDIKEIAAVENAVYLFLDENDTTKCEIKINLKTPLYSFLGSDGFRKLSITKGDSIESITIKNEIREVPQQFTYYKGKTLEEICQQLHNKIGKKYAGNYVDFYKDKDGYDLKSFL